MCGFVTYFKENAQISDVIRGRCKESLFRRGPDSQKDIFLNQDGLSSNRNGENNFCYMLFARLAIQDLDPRSDQPFFSKDKKICMVFNGEIYNFIDIKKKLQKVGVSFNTNSDTEVLLESYIYWGEKFVNHIKGMFAVTIIDFKKEEVFVLRDHFGIKPLYYHISQNEGKPLIFSSNQKTILELLNCKNSINLEVLIQFFNGGGVADKFMETFIEDIFIFPPASYLKIPFDKIMEIDFDWVKKNTVQYWSLPLNVKKFSLQEAIKATDKVLNESMDKHLIADVPLTTTLSGGIDSSGILALATNKLTDNHNKQSFGYVNEYVKKFNEEEYMEIAASESDSKLNKLYMDNNFFYENLDEFLDCQFEPITNLSPFAQFAVYKEISKHGFKVALDGQGADEIFLGYGKHLDVYMTFLVRTNNFKKIKDILLGSKFGKHTQSIVMFRRTLGTLQTANPEKVDIELLELAKLIRDNYGVEKKEEETILNYAEALNFGLNQDYSPSEDSKVTPLQTMSKSLDEKKDFFNYFRHKYYYDGLQQLLKFEDNNAMHFSIENRVPYLYKDIAETVFKFPPETLISDEGVSKFALREFLSGKVSDKILERRLKVGLSVPVDRWNKLMMPKFKETIESDFVRDCDLFDDIGTKKIYEIYEKTNDLNFGNFLFQLYSVERFVRKNNLAYKTLADTQ